MILAGFWKILPFIQFMQTEQRHMIYIADMRKKAREKRLLSFHLQAPQMPHGIWKGCVRHGEML